jgi:hypothetical protein
LRVELLKVCPQAFGLFFVLDAGEYLFGPRNLSISRLGAKRFYDGASQLTLILIKTR